MNKLIFKVFKFSAKKAVTTVALAAFVFAAVKTVSPAARAVYSTAVAKAERILPIYCVETDKPQIAISFDAA